MIFCEGISKHFGGVTALNTVNFGVRAGTVQGLVGENGAGKSTLAKIISGLLVPDSGEIQIDSHPVIVSNPMKAASLGIALIPQELELVPFFSVAENIFLGNEPGRKLNSVIDWNELNLQCDKLLKNLELNLSPRMKVGELSVSQQQMVVIARALSKNARLLIMDEPTARLGEHEVEQILAYIEQLKNRGLAIIYISHHLDEIFRICDAITILRDGCVVGEKFIQDTNTDDVIRLMVDRKVEQVRKKTTHALGGEILMRVENVSQSDVVPSVSFDLRRGEIFGIAGLVGAGRTELIRAILGVDRRKSGKIYIEGKEVIINSYQDAIKNGLVLVPEERRQQGLVLNMMVRENVTLPYLKNYTRVMGYLDVPAEKKHTLQMVDHLRIKVPSIDAQASSLSGGNQQKVVLAKWLENNAKVYILDEPTRGIDVATKAEIHDLIKRLAESGAGVIVISSELPEILTLADRVMVMREGKMTAILNGDEITADNIMRNAIVN